MENIFGRFSNMARAEFNHCRTEQVGYVYVSCQWMDIHIEGPPAYIYARHIKSYFHRRHTK